MFFRTTAGMHFLQISQGCVSKTIKAVAQVIAGFVATAIVFPTGEELEQVSLAFYEEYDFPGIIGVIDGTHVRIQRPVMNDTNQNHPDHFYNRKMFWSYNVLVVVDAQKRILYLNSV